MYVLHLALKKSLPFATSHEPTWPGLLPLNRRIGRRSLLEDGALIWQRVAAATSCCRFQMPPVSLKSATAPLVLLLDQRAARVPVKENVSYARGGRRFSFIFVGSVEKIAVGHARARPVGRGGGDGCFTALIPPLHCASYVYNVCLAWYNVVLTPRIHSSVKFVGLPLATRATVE